MSKKILVVEDDNDIRDSLLEILDMEGFRVHGVENGQLALDYLRESEELPELLLLDLMMPVKNGYEVGEEIKNDSKLQHLPIIVMSADGQLANKKSLIQAEAYLKKPVDIELLMNTIGSVLG